MGEAGSFSHLLREHPNLVILRTFSKAFGLAGLRLGYALAHSALIDLLSRVKLPWNLPSVTLAAAEAALEDAAEFDARVGELKSARDVLARALDGLAGLQTLPSEGNFVLIDISQTGASAADFVAAVLAEGVLIRSLEVHHATRRFVRVTVGTREQNARCVQAIERVLGRRAQQRVPARLSASPSDAE